MLDETYYFEDLFLLRFIYQKFRVELNTLRNLRYNYIICEQFLEIIGCTDEKYNIAQIENLRGQKLAYASDKKFAVAIFKEFHECENCKAFEEKMKKKYELESIYEMVLFILQYIKNTVSDSFFELWTRETPLTEEIITAYQNGAVSEGLKILVEAELNSILFYLQGYVEYNSINILQENSKSTDALPDVVKQRSLQISDPLFLSYTDEQMKRLSRHPILLSRDINDCDL